MLNIENPSPREVAAAIKIQSQFRGFFARKKYQIKDLNAEDLKNYPVNVRGNDPVINGLPEHEAHEKIVIVATSGLRSVEIAGKMKTQFPKLIILDNSKQVIHFWRTLRKISENNEIVDAASFFLYLDEYYKDDIYLREKNPEKDFEYIDFLFKEYGFEKIKKILANTAIIGQSWADKNTFVKIRNIASYHKYDSVYTYPSNIVAYLHFAQKRADEALQVLENIALLNPTMTFHTNCCPYRLKPRKTIFLKDPDPKIAADALELWQMAPH